MTDPRTPGAARYPAAPSTTRRRSTRRAGRPGGRNRWLHSTLAALVLLTAGCSGADAPDATPTGSRTSAVPSTPPSSSAAAAPTSEVPPAVPGVNRLTVNGQPSVLLVPQTSNGRLVLFAHAAGATAEAVLGVGDLGRGDLAAGLVAAGYTVAASDAHGDAWGNATSLADYTALAREAAARTGTTSVYLVGESMGGLATAQLSLRGALPGVRAYAGIYPVCDLSSIRAQFADSIQAANGEGTAALFTALSPVPLDGSVPVKIWASEGDRTVPKQQNAVVCVQQAQAKGGRAELVDTIGDHGDVSNFDLPALLAFFDSAS